MKKVLLFICLLFFSSVSLRIYGEEVPGEGAPGEDAPGEEAPEIAFDSPDYNFGKVYQGENAAHTYVFRNKGRSDLVIESVKSSCGCTTALLSEKTIPPEEKGEIKATFSTGGRRGRQKKTITVISNDPKNRRITLTISGEVVVPIDLNPARISLREVFLGEGKIESVKVVPSEGFEDLKITKITSTSPHIEAMIEEPESPKKEEPGPAEGEKEKKEYSMERTLRIRISPDAPKGRLTGKVTLQYEDGRKGEVTLPVYARIVGNITAEPRRLSLGSISPEVGREAFVIVSDRKGKELTISRIEAGSDLLEVEQNQIDPSNIRLIVRVKKGAPPGEVIRGRLKIFTDDANKAIIEVPYVGSVRP